MRNNISRILACAAIAAAMRTATAVAQVAPVYSVPSPEAASLGTYGTVPVGLFTGVPEISVPIHEMKVGNMAFPIILSYHLSSVRPNNYPGSVGLGWSLNSGGCISRTVRGVPDEKTTGNYENGYYGSHSHMAGITHNQFDFLTRDFTSSDGPNWFELSADEFSFSFFGHSGNFYLSPQGEWVVVSDEDIKVEFDPSSGFYTMQENCPRIPSFSHWPGRDSNRRHFIEFVLVTPDGCRFTFGGLYATDFSVPYYSRRTGDLVATSWHLSRIETPGGHVITYQYESADCDLMADIRYSPSRVQVSGFSASGDNGMNTGRRGFTGFLLFPARLTSIITPNERILLGYKPDWRYEDAFADNYTGGALYWSEGGFSRTSLYQVFDSDPSTQFTYLLPNFDHSTDPVARQNIAGLFKVNVLHGIKIDIPGSSDTSVLFEYEEGTRRKLSRVAWRTGLVDVSTRYVEGGGVMHPFYSIPEETSDLDMPEYRFVYDPGRMPKGYILPQADRWGYWNGHTHSLSSQSMDAPSSVIGMKSETLTEVIYPTGGRTVFEYERNDYSRIEQPNHVLADMPGISGGLRVRSITSLSREGDVVSSKVYHYSESLSPSSVSSGIAKMEDPVTVSYSTLMYNTEWIPLLGSYGPYPVSMTISSMYGFGSPVTNLNSPDVGYSCVIEETLDQYGNSLGYVVNRFSNYGTDIHGYVHDDVPAHHSYNHVARGAGIPYTSNSAERGKLLSRSWHRADGTEVRSESYRYIRVNDNSLLTATQRMVYFSSNPYNVTSAVIGWLTYTNTYSYMLASTVTREREYCDSTWRSYSPSRRVVSESVMSSDGDPRVTTYTYPSDYPQEYGWMTSAHIVSPVVTTQVSYGGKSRSTINTYSYTGETNRPICYVSKVETRFGADGPLRTDYEVLDVDDYGNPTEIVEHGTHSVLQWTRQGQRLMKRVEGLTLEEYESMPVSASSAQPLSANAIVQPVIPDPSDREIYGKPVWSYSYDSRLNLTRAITPDGLTTFYDYDAIGRLSRESVVAEGEDGESEIKTVKKYVYHYHND
ncbi:MAG: RHS repeat protein [Bacteroidales bacterium]|nr:RHS repeat protein [Bacteroidales bacterium]